MKTALITIIVASLMLSSCGSESEEDDDGAGSTTGGTTTGGNGCPPSQPEDNTNCPSPGQQCTYGGAVCDCQEYRWFCQ